MQCHSFLRNLGGGKNAAFSSEMVSEEEEEKKVLFVLHQDNGECKTEVPSSK
jgi:hypothetical protein